MKVRRIDFYPDDWIAGTLCLGHEERSVYISVCVAIWSQGGPAPVKFVRQICPGPHFKRALDKLVEKSKVTLIESMDGPKVAQKRAESELERARKRTESDPKVARNQPRSGPGELRQYNGNNGLARSRAHAGAVQQPSINNHHTTLKDARAREEDLKNGKWKKAGHVIPRHNLAHASGGGPPCQCAACEACTCVECVEGRKAYNEKRKARNTEAAADSA